MGGGKSPVESRLCRIHRPPFPGPAETPFPPPPGRSGRKCAHYIAKSPRQPRYRHHVVDTKRMAFSPPPPTTSRLQSRNGDSIGYKLSQHFMAWIMAKPRRSRGGTSRPCSRRTTANTVALHSPTAASEANAAAKFATRWMSPCQPPRVLAYCGSNWRIFAHFRPRCRQLRHYARSWQRIL
jgi:hypothetical protein